MSYHWELVDLIGTSGGKKFYDHSKAVRMRIIEEKRIRENVVDEILKILNYSQQDALYRALKEVYTRVIYDNSKEELKEFLEIHHNDEKISDGIDKDRISHYAFEIVDMVRKEVLIYSIKSIMKTLKWNANQAMCLLEIYEPERNFYLKEVSKEPI